MSPLDIERIELLVRLSTSRPGRRSTPMAATKRARSEISDLVELSPGPAATQPPPRVSNPSGAPSPAEQLVSALKRVHALAT